MDKGKMNSEVMARFKHYPPSNEEEIKIHEGVRYIFKGAAFHLIELLPEKVINTREFSQVLTDLENAMMHANAAFARHKND